MIQKGSVVSGVMGAGLGLIGAMMAIQLITAVDMEVSTAWARRLMSKA